jgi:hypothetical protein
MGADGITGPVILKIPLIVTNQRFQIGQLLNGYSKMPKLNLNMVI